MNKRTLGSKYEEIAAEYLAKQGFRILQQNFRCRTGEIDIIARDGSYLVFVEVKYRSGKSGKVASEAVDQKKQRVISKTAAFYYIRHKISEDTPSRFDVVAIDGEQITLIKNAFEYQG